MQAVDAISAISGIAPSAAREAPPFGLEAWATRFDAAALPVLAATADAIEEWRAIEDDVDAHRLAESITGDPLMTLKLLAHVARLLASRRGARSDVAGEPETVTSALVMLGIGPFFRGFASQPVVEARLEAAPQALAGFRRVLRRSHRAAAFAIAFAAHRLDPDAALQHEAALLHDFAELLLWIEAPALALEIERRQQADPTLRSAAVQAELLGVELSALQHRLMQRWQLPSLLVQFGDDAAEHETTQMRTVRLAVRVARHSSQGWDNAALPDDIEDIGRLLQLAPAHALALLRDIDAGA